ncbi:hypothetical protein BDV06DRAFT_19312 [Aspergillus oleicola]
MARSGPLCRCQWALLFAFASVSSSRGQRDQSHYFWISIFGSVLRCSLRVPCLDFPCSAVASISPDSCLSQKWSHSLWACNEQSPQGRVQALPAVGLDSSELLPASGRLSCDGAVAALWWRPPWSLFSFIFYHGCSLFAFGSVYRLLGVYSNGEFGEG